MALNWVGGAVRTLLCRVEKLEAEITMLQAAKPKRVRFELALADHVPQPLRQPQPRQQVPHVYVDDSSCHVDLAWRGLHKLMNEILAELDVPMQSGGASVGVVCFQEFVASLSMWPSIECRDGNLRWISLAHPVIPENVKFVGCDKADVELCMQFYDPDVWRSSGAECVEQWLWEILSMHDEYVAVTSFLRCARALQLVECISAAESILDAILPFDPGDSEHACTDSE